MSWLVSDSKILVDDEIDRKDWISFVMNSARRSPFQLPDFFELCNSVNGFGAKVFAVKRNNELKALCVATLQKEKGVKGFFSSRAIIYGGPVFTEDKESIRLLLKRMTSDLKKNIYIETRNFNDYSDCKNEFENAGWKYQPYLNFHLNCSEENVVWKNLNNNRQRQIKKAFKEGVELDEANNDTDVNEFYKILSELYRTKIKKPLFPLEFFQNFIKSGVGKILLVKQNGKIIGGIAAPVLKNEAIYELYICGLDQEYKECSPSVMATYAAIEYGFRNGLKRFDFMGAGKPEEDYGVREFKEKFGGVLVEQGRFVRINSGLFYNIGKTAMKVIAKKKSKR